MELDRPPDPIPVVKKWPMFFEEDIENLKETFRQLEKYDSNDAVVTVEEIIDSFLKLLNPSSPLLTQKYLDLLGSLPLLKDENMISMITNKIFLKVEELDASCPVKFNILLILLNLNDRVISRPKERSWDSKLVISNRMVDLIWSCYCTNLESLKILALCLLHKFIENYESTFPPSIEKVLRAHLQQSLKHHKSPILRFLAYYISKFSFREHLTFDMNWYGELQLKSIGECNLYIEPREGLLLDDYGLTVFNASSSIQTAQVPIQVQQLVIKNGNWYWEFTVYSPRYLKICDIDERNGYILTTEDLRSSSIFGVSMCCDECEKVVTKVEFPSGAAKTFLGSGICLQIGSLQQVTFNFTSPTLKSLYETNRVKGSKLLTQLALNSHILPPFYNVPARSFRQEKLISALYVGNVI